MSSTISYLLQDAIESVIYHLEHLPAGTAFGQRFIPRSFSDLFQMPGSFNLIGDSSFLREDPMQAPWQSFQNRVYPEARPIVSRFRAHQYPYHRSFSSQTWDPMDFSPAPSGPDLVYSVNPSTVSPRLDVTQGSVQRFQRFGDNEPFPAMHRSGMPQHPYSRSDANSTGGRGPRMDFSQTENGLDVHTSMIDPRLFSIETSTASYLGHARSHAWMGRPSSQTWVSPEHGQQSSGMEVELRRIARGSREVVESHSKLGSHTVATKRLRPLRPRVGSKVTGAAALATHSAAKSTQKRITHRSKGTGAGKDREKSSPGSSLETSEVSSGRMVGQFTDTTSRYSQVALSETKLKSNRDKAMF